MNTGERMMCSHDSCRGSVADSSQHRVHWYAGLRALVRGSPGCTRMRWVARTQLELRNPGVMTRLLGAVLLVYAGSALAAGNHPVTPADITSLKDVVSVALAPSGDNVVYTVTSAPTEKCPGVTRLWAMDISGHSAGHRLEHTLAGDHAPAWAPDGHAYVFVRSAGTAPGTESADDACSRGGDFAHSGSDLWVSNGPGSAPHQLSHLEGSIKTFRWAPNGRVIAAVVTGSVGVAADDPDDAKDHTHRGVVYLIDVVTGKARPLGLPDNVSVYDLDWFPDGKRLVLRLGDSASYGAQFYESRLEVADLSGRVLDTIDEERVSYRHPSVSPDGHKLLIGRFFGSAGVAPVYTIYDLRSDTKTDVGASWPGTITELRWDTSDRLVGVGLKGVTTFVVSANADSGTVSQELALRGQAADFGAGAGGLHAYVGTTRTQPNEVWLYDATREQTRAITDTNPQVRSWQVADVRTVHWQSSIDDTELFGLLALPAERKSDEPLKMLVQPHGGPLYAWQDGWQGTWEAWAQVLTSHGYAVFMPNPRGSLGQGHAFANANVEDWGGGDYQDILDGVAKLVDDGVADPGALAIGGWSYGGYMTSWAAGHNDNDVRFKAAIVGAAPTDLFFMAFASDLGYGFTGSYMGDPFEKRDLYMRKSPVSSVRNVSIPTLVLHGADDHRVPTANGKLFFSALQHYGKVSKLVVYPHATHWLSVSVGSEAQNDVQRRVVGWIERYLGSADSTTKND